MLKSTNLKYCKKPQSIRLGTKLSRINNTINIANIKNKIMRLLEKTEYLLPIERVLYNLRFNSLLIWHETVKNQIHYCRFRIYAMKIKSTTVEMF